MTKLMLITGVVYTEMSAAEVRSYLQKGSKMGTINGYEDEAKTTPILISVEAIEYIYM
ncbi:hypothetical protein [Bacillus phage SPO1L1]|nr:hypothetical protein [Bacillus phage SPO1L1]WIT25998.1 hypothetical protein [Bacillus phage SPO1L2]